MPKFATVVGSQKTHPRVKIEWAKKHILHLDSAIQEFLRLDPYVIVEKMDAHAGNKRYYISIKREVSDDVMCITGNILHNLRSSLDHLVYSIMPAGNQWTRSHGFPVAQDANEYKAKRERRIKGLPQPLMDRIHALEPYQGGKGHSIWQLHELDIVDKHRLLIGIGIAHERSWQTFYSSTFGGIGFGASYFAGGLYEDTRQVILMKDGAEIFPTPEQSEVDVNHKLNVVIAFNEPQVIEPESVIPTLQQFVNVVEGIVSSFSDALP